jgi:hypothetical protein
MEVDMLRSRGKIKVAAKQMLDSSISLKKQDMLGDYNRLSPPTAMCTL